MLKFCFCCVWFVQVYYDPIHGYTYGGYEDPNYGYGYGAYDGYDGAYSGEYAYDGAYPEGYVPETYTEGGEAGEAGAAGEGRGEEGAKGAGGVLGVEDGDGMEGEGEVPPGFEEEAAAAAAALTEVTEISKQDGKVAEVEANGYSIEDQQMSPTGRPRPKGTEPVGYTGIDPWSGLYGDPANYAAYYEAPDGVYTTDPSAYPNVAAVGEYETLLTNHIPTWQQVRGRRKKGRGSAMRQSHGVWN